MTWFNQDPTTHTVTSLNGTELNSGNILAGVSFTHTFAQAGTYDYYCTLHPMMRGTVVVTPWWHLAVYFGVPLALVLGGLFVWRVARRA